MSKRVTIILDDDNSRKIRSYQVKMIRKRNDAYSFSRSINDILRGKK